MQKSTGINALDNLIDLKRIQHFSLLGDELHFSRAAERANLSQTAFSRSIQSLETDLKLRLFDRGTRSVKLTAAGRQLLGRARELLSNAHNLKAEANYITTAEGGELSFGTGILFTTRVLHPMLDKLRACNPTLKLNVEVNDWRSLSEQLLEERIEFFVGYADMLIDDPRFCITSLAAEPVSIFCASQHPLAHQPEAIRVEQLLDYPWVCARFTDSIAMHLRRLFGLPANTYLPITLNCNDLLLARHTALSSNSLLITGRAWLADDLQSDTILDMAPLIFPELPKELLYLNCSLVQLAGRTLSPAARRAVELTLENEAVHMNRL